LKVNLRPLWSPAAAALSLLAQRFGDLVWRLLFEELRKVTSEDLGVEDGLEGFSLEDSQHLKEGGGGDETSVGDPWEEERTWRDPSAHKLRSIIMIWEDPEGERKRLMKVRVVIHHFICSTT
jgi:U3 small nucleolar RNA-associated protein 20